LQKFTIFSKKTKEVPLISRQHEGQEVLSVSVVATLPSNIASPRRESLQGKACCSCSGLILIASTMESKDYPDEGELYLRKLQVQT